MCFIFIWKCELLFFNVDFDVFFILLFFKFVVVFLVLFKVKCNELLKFIFVLFVFNMVIVWVEEVVNVVIVNVINVFFIMIIYFIRFVLIICFLWLKNYFKNGKYFKLIYGKCLCKCIMVKSG